jgi:hypothetical protein
MRTMNDWKRTGLRSYYGKQVHEAVMVANAARQQLWEEKVVVRGEGRGWPAACASSRIAAFADGRTTGWGLLVQASEQQTQRQHEITALRAELMTAERAMVKMRAELESEQSARQV